jgi:hypothetical protein
MNLPTGFIGVDSDFGKEVGFTSDKFMTGCYLWGVPDRNLIWISVVYSKHKGSFRKMMEKIEAMGMTFRIPTFSMRMWEIGKKQGWNVGEDKN